jgi:hypothetical protein
MIGNRKFWDGVAMGAAAGALISLVLLRRRRPGPMEQTKMVVSRTAKRAMGKAQNTLGQLAGKLSDR